MTAHLGELEPESSDSSDDFAGGDTGEDTDGDDEMAMAGQGKRQRFSCVQQPTPVSTPNSKSVKGNNINSIKQKSKQTTSSTNPPTPKHDKASFRARIQMSLKTKQAVRKTVVKPLEKDKQLQKPTPRKSVAATSSRKTKNKACPLPTAAEEPIAVATSKNH